MSDETAHWRVWHTCAIVLTLFFVAFAGASWAPRYPLYTWWGTIVILVLAAIIVGLGVTGRAAGLLIGDDNRMSLSRLQMTSWTVLVLSAFMIMGVWRLSTGVADPLALEVPGELWALMGISTTSLVGAGLIKGNKKNQPPAEGPEVERTLERLRSEGRHDATVDTVGQLVVNTAPKHARWSDVFRGDEAGNAAQVSLGKFQMFYFTGIVLLTYGSMLATMFAAAAAPGAATPEGLPELDDGLIALLGISHAGYLVDKGVPHSQEAGAATRERSLRATRVISPPPPTPPSEAEGPRA